MVFSITITLFPEQRDTEFIYGLFETYENGGLIVTDNLMHQLIF